MERGNIKDALVKIGIDGGQGSLKVCLSVVDLQNSETLKNSVKDVFIVFIGMKVQENRANLRTIWTLLKLDEIDCIFCGDLKIANLLCGIKSHSCKYPCCWCLATIYDKLHYEKTAELRTVGGLIQCYKNEHDINLNLNVLNDSYEIQNKTDTYSVVGVPVFNRPHNETVLSIIAPSVLHYLLGVGNFGLVKLEENYPIVTKRWLKACGLSRNATCGHALNGNSCRSLLKKTHLLKYISSEVNEFVNFFEAFDKVVTGCFGNSLDPNYLLYLEHLEKEFNNLGYTETPKLHAMFSHIPHFLADKTQGLGVWSEQAFEGVHWDFNEHWKNYKREVNHPELRDKFTRAVITYNAKHFCK